MVSSGLKKAEIEDDGIQAILNAVGHENSNIRKIYLWGNNVSLNKTKQKMSKIFSLRVGHLHF